MELKTSRRTTQISIVLVVIKMRKL